MKTIKLFSIASVALSLTLLSCGGGNKAGNSKLTSGLTDNSEEYMNSEVNAIDQALPEIMVLPSDNLLKANKALTYTPNGVQRNYQSFLLKNDNNKVMVATIQNEFVAMNYPLNDLEQTLKQLATRDVTDEADELAKDAKNLLLTTATPDIIIELDYKSVMNRKSYNSTLNYTLSLIDAYTNKVFSSKSVEGADGKSITDAFSTSLKDKMPEITGEIKRYFSDILTKGREISIRVTVENGSNIKLTDESIEGNTYSDWLEDYMNTHTVKGTFRLKLNTKNEMSFSNVRIPTLNEDGTQYSSYQWGRELAKTMRNQLGVKISNRTQGLADVHLVITGI